MARKSGGMLTGAVIGGIVGAAAALLFAPKKGSELRQDIADKSRQLKDKTQAVMQNVSEKAQDIAQQASDKAQRFAFNVTGNAKAVGDKMSELGDKAKSAVARQEQDSDMTSESQRTSQ